jgi:NarL family two-component system sensor histidine kinase YdfH
MNDAEPSLFSHYWLLWKQGIKESRTELPFFWFLTVILTSFMIGSLIYIPFSSIITQVLFALLMSLHILLYWVVLAIDNQSTRAFLLYFTIQVLIILVLLLLIRNIFIAPAIIMTLIGQVSGFTIPSRIKYTGIVFLGFLLFFYIWIIEPTFFSNPFLTLVVFGLVLVFQFIFTSVYNQTSNAKLAAQEALKKLEAANLKIEQMTRTEERQRIARELHDTLAQGLTGIILQLDAADHYLEKGDIEKAQSVVQRSMQAARETLADSRLVIDDLRQFKQPITLQQKLEEISSIANLNVQLSLDLPGDLSSLESEIIEKVTGEALTNVQKHANASQVQIMIAHAAGEIQLQIADDGIGFNPINLDVQNGHYGLLGIQERIQAVQGTFEVQSQPTAGCKLRIHFPRIKD